MLAPGARANYAILRARSPPDSSLWLHIVVVAAAAANLSGGIFVYVLNNIDLFDCAHLLPAYVAHTLP